MIVVGGGNSAAQILGEISTVTDTRLVSLRQPRLLPDDVDGRVLFDVATRHYLDRQAGRESDGVAGLGDIVTVPPVRAARDRGVLRAEPMFSRLLQSGVGWADDRIEKADTIIWCTGFRPALAHLVPLGLGRLDGRVVTAGSRARDDACVHLLGYGDWTGPASATLVGAGRTAKGLVNEITARLRPTRPATV